MNLNNVSWQRYKFESCPDYKKTKDMKQALETIIHDFLTDPLHYITITLAWVLICVLIGGAITSVT